MLLVDVNNKDDNGNLKGIFGKEPKNNNEFILIYSDGRIGYNKYYDDKYTVMQSPTIPTIIENKIYDNSLFGSVSINSLMLWHLTYVLNQNDFLLFMRLSRNILLTLDIQYFNDIDRIPMSLNQMSKFLNLELNDCKEFISRLIDKNILKLKYCTYEKRAMQIYIINPYIFNDENYPINENDNEFFIDDESTNLDDYFPNYFLYKTINNENKSTYNPERNTPEYKQWRIDVFERDNYTCQCCGSKEKLNAHHIKNFSSHIELRHDLNNGITLCNNCHNPKVKGSFHNIYGVYNNTKEQLEEYINSERIKITNKKQSKELGSHSDREYENGLIVLQQNKKYLFSDEFKETFPSLYVYVNDNKELIEKIYDRFGISCNIHKYENGYISVNRFRYFISDCGFKLYETNLFFNKLTLLLALGIIQKIDENKVKGSARVLLSFNKNDYISYRMVPDVYIIKEFDKDYFIEYEKIASILLASEINIENMKYEDFIKYNEEIFNEKCFDISHNKKDKRYIGNDDKEVKELCEHVSNILNKQDFFLYDDVLKINKHMWFRYSSMITHHFNLREYCANEYLNGTYGLPFDNKSDIITINKII